LVGLSSNIAFLQRLIQSKAFAHADLDTGLIERNQAELFPVPAKISLSILALAVIRLVISERHSNENDPWDTSRGWRMNSSLLRTFSFEHEGEPCEVGLRYLTNGWIISAAGEQQQVQLHQVDDDALTLQVGTQSVSGTVVRHGESFHVFNLGQHIELSYADPLLHAGESEAEAGRLTAPMPGKIVALLVTTGQSVKKGEPLLIMEAMKMEHTIAAPKDGVVKELMYVIGDQVADGAQLLTFE